jgi:hypothetical protein
MKKDDYTGQIEACGHIIDFIYNNVPINPESDLTAYLEQEAEERARKHIAEDYTQGELCCYFCDYKNRETEYRGWWKINRDR